jgi:hypothetical protein
LQQSQGTCHVDLEHRLELGQIRILDRSAQAAPGVNDDDVGRPVKAFDRREEQPLQQRVVGGIARDAASSSCSSARSFSALRPLPTTA